MSLEYLFSPEKIGNVLIKNRLVRSATFVRRAEKNGEVGEREVQFYTTLAQGGVGLIITGFVAVDPSGSVSPNQAALYDDSFIPGHKRLVDAVHDMGAKVAVQIGHTGRQGAHPKYPPVAPSPIKDKFTNLTPRELSTEEIYQYIQKFVDASRRAYESGYDMVQLHGAHGYLLSNFISPYTNKRTDEFGGTIQNRMKVIVDIFKQFRHDVDKNFPMTVKLQTQDFVPEGLTLEEGIEAAHIAVGAGYSAIEPSGGIDETLIGTKSAYPSLMMKSKDQQNYFLPTAKLLMPNMKGCKLILMGGIRDPTSAENILKQGHADFISMSRPLIYEPNLPNRWLNGDLSPAKCVSCNSCYMSLLTGEVFCMVRRKLEQRQLRKEKKQ